MASPQSLPSLFGRFTEILSEHEDLRVTLDRLGDLCDALERDERPLPRGLAPLALIQGLESELERHFRAEEAKKYFGTIAADHPSLAHRVLGLKADHQVMLGALRELTALARDEGRWADVPPLGRRFILHLRAHEHAETRLLQEFFLRDEGSPGD